MKKTLKQIRDEFNKEVEGPDVQKIEEKFREDLTGEPVCSVENCNANTFRGTDLCRVHFLETVKQRELQRKKDEKTAQKKMKDEKAYWKQYAIDQFRGANRICSVCGTAGLHIVREKSKNRRPIRPNHFSECLEVVCRHCVEAGR